MCKIYYFVWNMSYTASIVILTAIATERYIAIRFPLRARKCITQRRLFFVQGFIWMIAAVYGTPYLFIFDLQEYVVGGVTNSYCFYNYNMVNMKALVTTNFIIWYLVPLVLMSYMYCRIGISLWKVSKTNMTPKAPKVTEVQHEDSYYSTSSSEGQGRKKSIRLKRLLPNSSKEHRDSCTFCISQRSSRSDCNGKRKRDSRQCSCEKIEAERNSSSSSCDINTNHSKHNGNVSFIDYKTSRECNVPKLRVYFNTEQTRMNCSRAVRSRRRVIRLLVAVVISFAVCVLPHHIRILLHFWKVPMYDYERILSPVSFLILYLNSALNPILYALFSANFRKSFKESIPCRRKRRHIPFFQQQDTMRSGSC